MGDTAWPSPGRRWTGEEEIMRRIVGGVLLIISAVLLATACATRQAGPGGAGSTEAQGVIHIGASLALTGNFSPDSKLVRDGYQFWASTLNNSGGLRVDGKRYRVELVIKDDGSDREQAVRLVENLITQENVDFLLAPWGSGNTNAVAPIADRYQKLMIAPLAASDAIWKVGYKYLFGILPPGSTNLWPVVQLGARLGVKRVAVLSTDDLFPLLAAGGAVEEAKRLGLNVVMNKVYPPGTVDVGSVITLVQNSGADMVLNSADAEDAIRFIKQLNERGFIAAMVSLSGAVVLPDFLSNLGKDAEYLYGFTFWSPKLPWKDKLFGSAQEFASKFKDAYGYAPTHDVVAASIAGYVLQRAIEQVNSLDVAKVREALRAFNEETVFGPIDFAESGVNMGVTSYAVQIQGGVPVIVYPEAVAAAPPRYPTPAWNKR